MHKLLRKRILSVGIAKMKGCESGKDGHGAILPP